MNEAAFKTRMRHLLMEFGVEPFVVIGYRGQDSVKIEHVTGEKDRRSIEDLVRELYLPEYRSEAEWWSEGD